MDIHVAMSDVRRTITRTVTGARTKSSLQLKFVLSGLLHGLAAPPFIIKMCPPLTTKNWAVYQPLLAVGKLCS